MERKFLDAKLAARVRDEVFEDWEQHLLRKQVGKTYIDIADQLLHHFGQYWMRITDENEFLKSCAIIKFQKGEYLLKQLEVLNRELENLMNPTLFYSRMRNTGQTTTNMSSDTESKSNNINTAGSFTYSFDESSSNSNSASLAKGAVTQTSQQNKQGLEKKWRKHPLIDVPQQLVGKKEFDPNKVLQKDKLLEVKEAHYEVIPQEEEITEIAEGDLYSTMNLGITGDKSTAYSANNSDSVSLSRNDGDTNSTSGTHTVTDFTIDKDFTQYVANDAALRSIRLNIPRLQVKFFTLFLELFQEPFI